MKKSAIIILLAGIFAFATVAFAAYHHEGEQDSGKFLSVYPETAGTKLDHCALCHSGGEYENNKGKMVSLGSCLWCHYSYGYDGAGDIETTINPYGAAFKSNGRNAAAVSAIDGADADGDGYTNQEEINQGSFPGNADDHPELTVAPHRIYTRAQLEALPQHTEFLMMNTSRSGDFYAEYSGVPMKDLLDDAVLSNAATGITAYAPDGFAWTYPLNYTEGSNAYHVHGNMPGQSYQYPPATYFYDKEADQRLTDYGWCEYTAPSCIGRAHGDAIPVTNGLKAILALKREGVALDSGVLTGENKLDGEGPYRLVVPQKVVSAPDQLSPASNQTVIWPYNNDWDHNAGACTRTVTIIKVEPLPKGTTDIDVLEAGWGYVDSEKIIIYGAIDGTDSNGNDILDSEEGMDNTKDFDGDGTPDYKDSDTASLRPASGIQNITINTNEGYLANLQAYADTDPAISQTGKPAISYPYGAVAFSITGLTAGASVEVSMVFPDDVPKYAQFYKITSAGWQAVDFGSNNGDNTITMKLTDGDPNTDADGVANGVIVDPSALGIPAEPEDAGDSDGGSCFIMTVF